MKKLLIAIGVAVAISANAQTSTNASSGPTIWQVLQASNVFAIPYINVATKSHDIGGGLAIGYKVAPFAAAVIRVDDWKGKFYTASFGAELQPPQTWLGKIPFTPVAYTGVETPLSSGDGTTLGTDYFVGAGGFINFSFLGDNWFSRHVELIATYEVHAALPEAEKRQIKAGPIIKFSF